MQHSGKKDCSTSLKIHFTLHNTEGKDWSLLPNEIMGHTSTPKNIDYIKDIFIQPGPLKNLNDHALCLYILLRLLAMCTCKKLATSGPGFPFSSLGLPSTR